MWYTSESDRKYYERLDTRKRAKTARRERLKKLLPRRMEILQMVKDGKITLKEAQGKIRKEEKNKK